MPAAYLANALPGFAGPEDVSLVGSRGYYWSASPNYDYYVYSLNFDGDSVLPNTSDARFRATSVRLVTESK